MSTCYAKGCGASTDGSALCGFHEELCQSCGRSRGNHNVRHMFVGSVAEGAPPPRSNPHIQMHGGLTIDLLDPDPDDLVLSSLAYALGHLNRYTGHLGVYSVAEHLVLGTRILRDQGYVRSVQAGYLMHDAHEAVTGDVSSPVKAALKALGADFVILEDRHERAVERRFRVVTSQPAVKAMDLAMCRAEMDQGFGRGTGPDVRPAPVKIKRWDPAQARCEFLDECVRLEVA